MEHHDINALEVWTKESFDGLSALAADYKNYIAYLKAGGSSGIDELAGELELYDSTGETLSGRQANTTPGVLFSLAEMSFFDSSADDWSNLTDDD